MNTPGVIMLKGEPKNLVGPHLKAGDPAPDFQCLNVRLEPVTLRDTGRCVRLFSVIPSLDTPICDMQTKRFNDVAARREGIDFYSVSTDLPFAEQRYCTVYGTDDIKMLSDHRDTSFGKAYGVLIPDMRILARAIFVLDPDNVIRYAEYVPDLSIHPNYEAALAAARELAS